MIYGMYNSAAGALLQDARVNTISNNMANVKTTGFRKNFITFMDRKPESRESFHFSARNKILDRMHGGMFIKGTPWDRSHGSIKQTGREFDVAIDGDGFFRVSDGNDEFLTRAGNFRRNDQNELVTMDGKYNVLNDEGENIVIDRPGDIHISEDGTISAGGEPVTRLGLTDVENTDRLVKRGKVLFENLGGDGNYAEFEGSIMHKALETSNVSSVKEMSNLIRAQRAYGTNVKAMQIQYATLQRTVNGVGQPPGQ